MGMDTEPSQRLNSSSIQRRGAPSKAAAYTAVAPANSRLFHARKPAPRLPAIALLTLSLFFASTKWRHLTGPGLTGLPS